MLLSLAEVAREFLALGGLSGDFRLDLPEGDTMSSRWRKTVPPS
jgi:hypothetical protein